MLSYTEYYIKFITLKPAKQIKYSIYSLLNLQILYIYRLYSYR